MKHLVLIIITALVVLAVSCTKTQQEVNLYTDRHYDTDQQLLKQFSDQTGIKVNVVKAKSDELITRLETEGSETKADLLITADVGRLFRAADKQLLTPVQSEILANNIPQNLRDEDNYWFGLTMRARVVAYALDRVNPDDLSTYHNLTDERWNGKILVRSSSNIYNQSLMASFVALYGEDGAFAWAQGIVNNMARTPKGNDRAQVTAVAAGEGDLAIVNTYYIGKMLHSSNPEEVKVALQVGIFFPEQTHINISGAGITKHGKNKDNALKLLEFLSSPAAQQLFAEANYEYPVNPAVQPSELLRSWGTFKSQNIALRKLGEYNNTAVTLLDKAGWK